MFNITIEDNKSLKKFFKANSKYHDAIVSNINTILPTLITDKPYKIKTAHGYKYKNHTIFEYKIKLDKYIDCRVAYTIENNNIIVFFISNTIIKKEFVKLLESLDHVS